MEKLLSRVEIRELLNKGRTVVLRSTNDGSRMFWRLDSKTGLRYRYEDGNKRGEWL